MGTVQIGRLVERDVHRETFFQVPIRASNEDSGKASPEPRSEVDRRLTVDNSAGAAAPAGGRPRQATVDSHRSRRRQEVITMTSSFAPPGDACVRGEWLAVASLGVVGDLEGRVHGGHPSGVISPFFTDSSTPLLSRFALLL
jgi:hypothetical protein